MATTTRRGGTIDRFRDRIVFPFRDRDGDIVGVTARINPDVDDPKSPKYLNTPATDAFRKSELLLTSGPGTPTTTWSCTSPTRARCSWATS